MRNVVFENSQVDSPVIDQTNGDQCGILLDERCNSAPSAAVDPQIGGESMLRGRVLLAEDGLDSQRLITMFLSDAGIQVSVAGNGKIALEMAGTKAFDLILMDMQMPVMDGGTATMELRRRGFAGPIVALTAQVSPADRLKCIESGCSDYLAKPVTEEALLRTVAQHLGCVTPPALAIEEPDDSDAGGTGRIVSSLLGYPGMRAVIGKYVEGLPAAVASLQELSNRQDWPSVRRLAHQLRGDGGGFGFDAITECAGVVEDSIAAAGPSAVILAQVHSLIDVIRRIDGFDESKAKMTGRKKAS